jgi:AAA15 family ATPase/GTPase
MLINFKFSNFRLFKDETNLQLKAFDEENKERLSKHFSKHNLYLNRLALIYGANASGKSTVIYAITIMQFMVKDSFLEPLNERFKYTPYAFTPNSNETEINFEVELLINEVRYKYSFSYTGEKITKERLESKSKDGMENFFERTFQEGIHYPKVEASDDFKKEYDFDNSVLSTKPYSLFLTTAVLYNCQQFKPVFDWFLNQLVIVNQPITMRVDFISEVEKEYLQNEQFKQWFDSRLKTIDENVVKITFDLNSGVGFHLHYLVDDKEYPPIPAQLSSQGTRKFVSYSKVIYDALSKGQCLFLDELDENWHPLIVRNLIEKFNYNEENNAQLIATTHDVAQLNNLENNIIKQDQIWFTKKDNKNKAELYSLAEYKDVEEKDVELDYLMGAFGATPNI